MTLRDLYQIAANEAPDYLIWHAINTQRACLTCGSYIDHGAYCQPCQSINTAQDREDAEQHAAHYTAG